MVSEKKSKISIVMLFVFALLGIPRVIAHDLKWVDAGDLVNTLLVFIPPLIWLVVVLWRTKKGAFKDLLLIGIFYGILLGITHQILWTRAFDTPPTLGGNLSDLSPTVNAIITRTFAFISSLFTGTLIGLILGVIGGLIQRMRRK